MNYSPKAGLEPLYHETNRSISDTHAALAQLNNYVNYGPSPQNVNTRKIETSINTIISNCDRLDVLVSKLPAGGPGGRRENWKTKVHQMKADVRSLQSDFSGFQARSWNKEREISDRDQLLSMRFTTNAEAAKASGIPGGNDESTSILIDKALEHQSSLHRSNREVDLLLDHGREMLSSLVDQRSVIKGFRKKMLDVASFLGLSNTVMRHIEKRSEGDKWILFGGMLFTCFIMFLVIRWFT